MFMISLEEMKSISKPSLSGGQNMEYNDLGHILLDVQYRYRHCMLF